MENLKLSKYPFRRNWRWLHRYIAASLLLSTVLTVSWCEVVTAQVSTTLDVYGPNHYNVRSYDGLVPNQTHRIHIQLRRPGVNYQNWSIRAMIVQPLHSQPANVSGLEFPVEKLKFRFISENISGNPPQPYPTLQNLQLPLTGRPLLPAGAEVPIITQAIIPLQTGSSHYVSIDYNFKIDIEGGRYLGDMLSEIGGSEANITPATYRSSIRFTLYNEQQQAVSQSDYPITIQLHRPLGNPPPDEGSGFNLEVIGTAREGTLAFNTISNYLEENTVTYYNGIKVTAPTGYELQVKSMQSSFLNQQGQTLPLDVLRVRVNPTPGAPADAVPQPARLSTVSQTIVTSTTGGHQTHYYDLQYSTDAGDSRLPGTLPGRYAAVLLYELTPR